MKALNISQLTNATPMWLASSGGHRCAKTLSNTVSHVTSARSTTSPPHQQKKLFLGTDRARFLTNSVRSLRTVLPDLLCLLCLSFLASGVPGRPTFPPQRPTRLVPPHPLLVPPPCIRPLILSSTGLLPTRCVCVRLATISATLTPLATYICPLPSASVRCHPTSLFS